MANFDAAVGQHMQRLRELTGLSQRDVSEQLGLDASTLSRAEAGQSRWPVDTFVRYNYALGMDPAEELKQLLGETESRPPESLWETQ